MKNIIVASHRRSGTHVTIDSITNNFADYNNEYLNIDRIIPGHKQPLNLAELKEELKNGGRVIKTHMLPTPSLYFNDKNTIDTIEKIFDEADIIYVVRNGMDVVLSLYHYMGVYDESIKRMQFSEFIKTYNNFDPVNKLNRADFWAYHYKAWTNNNYRGTYLNISFEDWLNDYKGTIHKISNAFNIRANRTVVNVLVNQSTGWINKLKGVFAKSEVKRTSVSFRKGKAGEGSTYIGTEEMRAISAETLITMAELGYGLPNR